MKRIKNIQNVRGTILFGFIFLGYKDTGIYWEFSKMYLRISMQICYELIIEQYLFKEIIAGTILIIYCGFIYKLQPYEEKYFNFYDLLVNFILFTNVYYSHF